MYKFQKSSSGAPASKRRDRLNNPTDESADGLETHEMILSLFPQVLPFFLCASPISTSLMSPIQ